MNIFYISEDAAEAARMLTNSHVVKMILESCQLLSTAHRLLDGEPWIDVSKTGRKVKRWRLDNSFLMDSKLYQATHINHPSAVWVRESGENYRWLFEHLLEMLNEYTYRYGKRHKCSDLVNYLSCTPENIPRVPFFQPPCAMDAKYIVSESSVENYRNYYRLGKTHLHKWKNREVPTWIY